MAKLYGLAWRLFDKFVFIATLDRLLKNNMNVLDITPEQFYDLVNEKKDRLEIIDVRELEEYRIIRISGSQLIPGRDMLNRLDEVDWTKTAIFICRSGSRSRLVANVVSRSGIRINNLVGGLQEVYKKYKDWDELYFDEDRIKEYF